MAQANFDYENVSSYMMQTTSGHKLILIESHIGRFEVEEGDVIGVQFPASKPTAALKTSLSSFSFLYNNSVLNSIKVLRGNRLPSTADSPVEVRYAPAIAILYSAVSERKFQHRYQKPGNKTVSLSVDNSLGRENLTRQIILQEAIKGLKLNLPDAFPSAEDVNVTADITNGTDVTYKWEFSDVENNKSCFTPDPWVTHVYMNTGKVNVTVSATNNVSFASTRCSTVVQERITGLKIRKSSLFPIENGTIASIGWLLRNGSHVHFNITITSKEGEYKSMYLTNAETPGATVNLTIPGLHLITITAKNKVNSLLISGNLSVQQKIAGVEMTFRNIVKTNQPSQFTLLPHPGDRTARYTLLSIINDETMSIAINTTQKNISHVYRKAGKYKVVLIASNDISSAVQKYSDVTVQDEIKGFEFKIFEHEIENLHELAYINWTITQGTDVDIFIDYGDAHKKSWHLYTIEDRISNSTSHNYTKPGKYLVIITAQNLVSEKRRIEGTIYVEPFYLNIE